MTEVELLYENAKKIALISGTSIDDVLETYRRLAFEGRSIEQVFSYPCFKSNNWLKMHGHPKRRKRI